MSNNKLHTAAIIAGVASMVPMDKGYRPHPPRGGKGSRARWQDAPHRQGREYRHDPVTGLKLRKQEDNDGE